MRVLLFHFTELGSLGRVDVAVVTLAEALLARGSSPAIVEITPEGKPPRALPNGIPVWSVASASYPSPSRPRSWASFMRSAFQFRKSLKDFRPDIVHVHFPVAQCLPAVALASFPRKWKLIVTVHNSDIRVSPIQAPAIIPWQRRLFGRADSLTAVSQSLLEDADTAYPNFRAKARVIRNGVGPRWFQLPLEPDPSANYVLFVGRLHPVKGVDVLLHAWKSASLHFPKTELWLAGDGPNRQEYETLVKDLNLSSSIRFLGRKSEEDLPLLYRNSKVLVLPSRREGLPITLLEAGACGAICIGTQTPGIPEIINENQTGFVVQTDSPEQLSQAIIKSLQMSPAQSLAFRQAARKRIVDEFSETGMIDQYVSLYESVLR